MSNQKRIKIVFCIPELVIGGSEIALCEMLLALKETNIFDLSVITFNKITHPRYKYFFEEHGITVLDASKDKTKPKFLRNILRLHKARKYFKQQDIIVDFKYTYAYRFYRGIKKPKICWLHCGFNYFQKHLNAELLSKYDKVVCLSDDIVREIKENYPVLQDKVVRIYNPINVERILNQSNDIMFSTDGRYFVAVQRLDPYEKDVETVIRAFNIFAESNKELKLYIVGGGSVEYTDYLKRLCKTDRIIFTGELKNSYGIIKNANALILSSTKEIGEGLPLVLLEAQALETLCISSNVKSGPPEILMQGEAGLLFEPGNAEDLANMMDTVVNSEIKNAKIIKCAKESITRFASSKSAIDFIQLINTIDIHQQTR